MTPILRAMVRDGGTNALAVLALIFAAAGYLAWIPALFALGALAVVAGFFGRTSLQPGLGLLGKSGASRLVIAAAVVVVMARSDAAGSSLGALAAVIVLLFTGVEPQFARVWRSAARPVTNLPGVRAQRSYERHGGRLVLAGMVVLVLAMAGLFAGTVYNGIVLALAVLMAAIVVWWFRAALRDRAQLPEEVTAAVQRYAPDFMVYISGPTGTGYQLKMWLPFFERLERRFVVIAREGPLARSLADLTGAPVIAARTLAELEQIQLHSMNAAFYVNNGAKNTHNVRYRHMTHVQLLHGESDKPSSYNAVTGMFDKIFVAGQAGIDRYSDHGITIPTERFEIVGRPQVSGITRTKPSRERSIALYAPTWTGFNTDNNFGSLPEGHRIADALVAAGWVVIFRPHPYSLRDAVSRAQVARIEDILAGDAAKTGRSHVYGVAASQTMSLEDCFNQSDVLVSDVSSVPADYLFSEKPFVITKMSPISTEDYLAEFRLARAGYVADMTADDGAAEAIARLESDDRHELRRQTRIHYLGDIPAENYEHRFIDAARDIVDTDVSVDTAGSDTFSVEEEFSSSTDAPELGQQESED